MFLREYLFWVVWRCYLKKEPRKDVHPALFLESIEVVRLGLSQFEFSTASERSLEALAFVLRSICDLGLGSI